MGRPSALTPVLHIKDNAVFANSRDVADYFGKLHKHVLRDIVELRRGLPDSGPTPLFNQRAIQNPQNYLLYPTYDMTKDGFTLLVMGYTGTKALEFKLRYIQRFNEMEAALREQPVQPLAIPQDYSTALRALADATDEKLRIEQAKQVVEAKLVEAKETLAVRDVVIGKNHHELRHFAPCDPVMDCSAPRFNECNSAL